MKTPECPIRPLSLDEAIAHADEVAGDCSTSCKREHKQLADWLRELKSRRSVEYGDAAKLREAVEICLHTFQTTDWTTLGTSGRVVDLIQRCKSALAEPPRQCEVGTAEEQEERFVDFCSSHYRGPVNGMIESAPCNCPCWRNGRCNNFVWANMPYVEKEGGAI